MKKTKQKKKNEKTPTGGEAKEVDKLEFEFEVFFDDDPLASSYKPTKTIGIEPETSVCPVRGLATERVVVHTTIAHRASRTFPTDVS